MTRTDSGIACRAALACSVPMNRADRVVPAGGPARTRPHSGQDRTRARQGMSTQSAVTTDPHEQTLATLAELFGDGRLLDVEVR